MKQTIMPTKGEAFFHLHAWGCGVAFLLITILDILGLLFLSLLLQFSAFAEEQIAICMPFLVIGCWMVGAGVAYCLHKQHLTRCGYDISIRQKQLFCMASQVYASVAYFTLIALF